MAQKHKIYRTDCDTEVGSITCATESGFYVYKFKPSDPYEPPKLLQHFACNRSVILGLWVPNTKKAVLVGGGSRPKYPSNVIEIRDKSTIPTEKITVTFETQVLFLKCLHKRLIVCLKKEIKLFYFHPQKIGYIRTLTCGENPHGLIAIPSSKYMSTLAYPGELIGTVVVINFAMIECMYFDLKPKKLIKAHQNQLACLAMDETGALMATASDYGTLIRVWNVESCDMIFEFRRGFISDQLICMSFSSDAEYLCVTTNQGYAHVYSMINPQLNNTLWGSFGSMLLGNLGGVRSLVDFQIPAKCGHSIFFGKNRILTVVCVEGTMHQYQFTMKGVGQKNFCKYFYRFDDEYECVDSLINMKKRGNIFSRNN